MNENELLLEIERYIKDKTYNYAVLIDGEWGSGKTYFIKNKVLPFLQNELKKSPVYVSLYGCKSIDEIKERLILPFLLKDKNIKSVQKVLRSHRFNWGLEVAKEVLECAQNVHLYSFDLETLIKDFIEIKDCVCIFDDVERCKCDVFEFLGFANSLVEHGNVKIVLIANEKEIESKAIRNTELQYLIATNNKIDWKKGKNDDKEKISISELVKRSELLFGSVNDIDKEYGKVKEKLIGKTLYYKPDLKNILEGIIDSSVDSQECKNTLLGEMSFFNEQMNRRNHHNIRTFQSFVSKYVIVFDALSEIEYDDYYKDQIKKQVLEDCFTSCILQKCNIQKTFDPTNQIMLGYTLYMPSIDKYVNYGDLSVESLRSDIERFIEEHLRETLKADDPLNKLYNSFWLLEENQVKMELERLYVNLEKGIYSATNIPRIVILLFRLKDLGILIDLGAWKEPMIKQVSLEQIDITHAPEMRFLDDGKLLENVGAFINEIAKKSNKEINEFYESSIEKILKSEKWTKELLDLMNSSYYKDSIGASLFEKASAEQWVDTILKSTPEQVVEFRELLHEYYINRISNNRLEKDLPIVKEIVSALDKTTEDKIGDVILEFNIGWLKKDFERIINDSN